MKLLFDTDVDLDSWGMEITDFCQTALMAGEYGATEEKCCRTESGYQTPDEELNHNILAAGYEE